MIRWLLLLLGGALLGGIVHLATIIVLPRTATQDAYSRLAPIAPVNSVMTLPEPTPEKAVMPLMDPAFASAICRYDLSQGPMKLTVPVGLAYTSVSFYTNRDIAIEEALRVSTDPVELARMCGVTLDSEAEMGNADKPAGPAKPALRR
jgi:uncharacterized membrane protein